MEEKLESFKRNAVIVTGAGGYLGSDISLRLASLGAKIYLLGRTYESLAKTANKIIGAGGEAICVKLDLRSGFEIEEFFEALEENEKSVVAVIHNAHSSSSSLELENMGADYEAAFSIAFFGVARFNLRARNLLQKSFVINGTASIVHVASMYGMVSPNPSIYGSTGLDNPAWYGAAKAAMLQYTRWAAIHFAPDGIRVNSVSPGAFPSQVVQESFPEFVKELEAKTPLGRIGKPPEIAAAIAFLASEDASFVTGANLAVDGGWTAW